MTLEMVDAILECASSETPNIQVISKDVSTNMEVELWARICLHLLPALKPGFVTLLPFCSNAWKVSISSQIRRGSELTDVHNSGMDNYGNRNRCREIVAPVQQPLGPLRLDWLVLRYLPAMCLGCAKWRKTRNLPSKRGCIELLALVTEDRQYSDAL